MEAQAQKKRAANKQNNSDIRRGLDHVLSRSNERQKEILLYRFELPKKEVMKMKRDDLI